MTLKILARLLFILFLVAMSLNLLVYTDNNLTPSVAWLYMATSTLIGVLLIWFEWRFKRELARELVSVVFGLGAGLAGSVLIVLIVIAFLLPSASPDLHIGDALVATFARVQPFIPLILMGCCYLAITVIINTRDDFRFLVPYIDFSQRGTQEGGLLLDTSAIIDGRIIDICTTHVISVPVIVPAFVIRELQTIADSSDKLKRLRGRRGLDMVSRLQRMDTVRVVVRESQQQGAQDVDAELVRLAKELKARIVTTDFNLNKVAQIEGVRIVNINDIANSLKPAVIPGDSLRLKILRAGQEEGQGVGYLDDGTMVVVDDSADLIGQEVDISITGTHQTSAGRLIFGRPKGREADSPYDSGVRKREEPEAMPVRAKRS